MSNNQTLVLRKNKPLASIVHDPSLEKLLRPTAFSDILLDHGKWRKYDVGEFCHEIRSWLLKGSLSLGNNYEPMIFKNILEIRFDNLTELSLPDNRIQTIESISRLWMPELQKLQLQQNKILSVSDIRKLNTPSLKQIKLYKNLIIQLDDLREFGTYELRTLKLELFKSHPQISMSATFLLTIPSDFIKMINLQSDDRILQLQTIKNIKQKYKKVRLYSK